MSPEKIPCSVLVLTRNSAKNLARCIGNLSPFGEILVHDANSEDNTVEIAKSLGARVLKQYETEEKSVRVKNFTDMRLKQRADARYDWVFYLDSDEYIPDALVAEIGEILKTAHIKTIIKMPRIPVIDGIPRPRSAFRQDYMPRIHHRKGGCTLKAGKSVHEKYVYDNTFSEVVTENPIYVPLPDVEDLRSKDNRYLTLEAEKIRREGYPLSHYIRYILFKEPAVLVWLTMRILLRSWMYVVYPDMMPFSHEWRYVRYHWRYTRAITGAMVQSWFRTKEHSTSSVV